MKTCFCIMPFGSSFNEIGQIIRQSARECGYKYVRGDMSKKSGSILGHIVAEIERASVVVVDTSFENPNVFYELGIAHQILGPMRVVLITQNIADKKPYDVHQFRQLEYTHDAPGRSKLRSDLPQRIREAGESSIDHEHWKIIRGRVARTKTIVHDLAKLISHPTRKSLDGLIIRTVSGLGSLAISDLEPLGENPDLEYMQALQMERDTLREVLIRGATLKAVLNPPRRFAESMQPERLKVRYRRLIGLLTSIEDSLSPDVTLKDVVAMRNCDFVVSPIPMPNQFVIGNVIAYEGVKRGGTGGFDLTHWETDAEEVGEICSQFDQFFDDSKRDMESLRLRKGSLVHQLREFYKEACEVENLEGHHA